MCITSATAEVVGTASTQLEPSNGLMHFDHEYYATVASPSCDDAVACLREEVVCEVEVSSEETPPAENGALPDICDLDFSILADLELWDNLEQLINADKLLGQSDEPSSLSPASTQIPSPQPPLTVNQEPEKQLENVKTLPPCDSVVDTFSVEHWSSHSSSNDFTASSSGIGSPFSDDLDSEDYGGFHWEESFTELFPALV